MLIHGAVLTSTVRARWTSAPGVAGPTSAREVGGTRLLRLRPTEPVTPAVAAPASVAASPLVGARGVVAPEAVGEPPAPPEAGSGGRAAASRGAAEALTVGSRDSRLWSVPVVAPVWDTERLAVRWRAEDARRAAEAAPQAPRGMSDWVRGEGRSGWGLAPGRVHLGSVVIPTCGGDGSNAADCGFGLLPNGREEHARWMRRYTEIRLQSSSVDLDRLLRERARGIRARRDAERSSRPPGGGE